jgi:hypothetical protein
MGVGKAAGIIGVGLDRLLTIVVCDRIVDGFDFAFTLAFARVPVIGRSERVLGSAAVGRAAQ